MYNVCRTYIPNKGGVPGRCPEWLICNYPATMSGSWPTTFFPPDDVLRLITLPPSFKDSQYNFATYSLISHYVNYNNPGLPQYHKITLCSTLHSNHNHNIYWPQVGIEFVESTSISLVHLYKHTYTHIISSSHTIISLYVKGYNTYKCVHL